MSNSAEVREQVDSLANADAANIVRHLAHELSQPLSTIESIAYYLDLILPQDASKAREQVEKLRHLVEQSNWIVSNAVDCVQAAPFSPERIPLAELIEGAIESCHESCARVEMDCDGALPDVTVDRMQGEHLLRNLFTFFCYAGTGAPIRFRAIAGKAGQILIAGSSQAGGYSQEELDALFESCGPALPAGAGLSIASMRRIASAHGGRIRARAEESRISIEIALPA